jgi:short-subunit dehydrogenase
MEKQQSIVVVTGSSTGIGFETSLFLARNGFYTYRNFSKIISTFSYLKGKRIISKKKINILFYFIVIFDDD